ncbi:MAG: hypothetical protein GY794_02820 [bacterium]|nr:hypothetical protein [bacterium]
MSDIHYMKIERYGRSRHLKIATAGDLGAVIKLDEAHWSAINAPLNTINCDATFLDLLDTDNNSRIICHELRDAIGWALDTLCDYSGLESANSVLRLEAINTDTSDGQRIHNAAGRMLAKLNKSDDTEISLLQIRTIKTQVESTPVSEAGILLEEASDDPGIRTFITDAIEATGGATHPSGKNGLGPTQLDTFIRSLEASAQWYQQCELASPNATTDIMPLSAETPAIYEIFAAVRGKIDQYFVQCQAAALDERFVQRMGWTESELETLDFDDPATLRHVLTKAPLARARTDGTLHFDDSINPCYEQLLQQFRTQVSARILGDNGPEFSAKQWQKITDMFETHRQWVDAKPDGPIDSLGIEKVKLYLTAGYSASVRELMNNSAETAFDLDNIRLTEKLVLFQMHLLNLANNFVSFPHLYDPNRRAMFETGTLIIDGRRFCLAIGVSDRKAHIQVAQTSSMFVLYLEVIPGATNGEPYEVAVPVTSGSMGNLCLHKRGLFIDVQGNQCDARVVEIIKNPISLTEAFVAPFIRLGRMLTGKIESLTVQAEKKLGTDTTKAVSQITTEPSRSGTPKQNAQTGNMLMGAGVAIAALGSAMAYITKTLSDTSWLAIVIGLLIAVLVVLLPTSIVAILKLRKRDLSAILEGSGWGINARMRLTWKMAKFFSRRPRFRTGTRIQ